MMMLMTVIIIIVIMMAVDSDVGWAGYRLRQRNVPLACTRAFVEDIWTLNLASVTLRSTCLCCWTKMLCCWTKVLRLDNDEYECDADGVRTARNSFSREQW
eukprot:3932333-Rhodomonas_salina.1